MPPDDPATQGGAPRTQRIGLLDLLAFACELAALALLAASGWTFGETAALSLLLAVALVGIGGWVWGRWMAPTSTHRLQPGPRTAAKVAFYLVVAGIGALGGRWIWAVALAVVALGVQTARREGVGTSNVCSTIWGTVGRVSVPYHASSYQASLLDTAAEPSLGPLGAAVVRHDLGRGAWLDVLPRWVDGADALFEHLHGSVPWRADERPMYDRTVAVPRLLAFYGERQPWPHPVVEAMRERLSDHYEGELGERFATAGLCLYRDGRDSVAWHGDRIGRGRSADTMVAIVSLGSPRRLLLRPTGGGASRAYALGSGDLVVMGRDLPADLGARDPEDGEAVGPRLSVQLRPRGVL